MTNLLRSSTPPPPRFSSAGPLMRRGALLGLVLLLAAAAALFTQPTEQAFAQQQSQTLVSNLGQSDGGRGAWGNDHAQAFTTGSDARGYTLNSVDIEIAGINDNSALSSKLTVTIRSNAGSAPSVVGGDAPAGRGAGVLGVRCSNSEISNTL